MDLSNANIQQLFQENPVNTIADDDLIIVQIASTGKTGAILGRDLNIGTSDNFAWVSTSTYSTGDPVIYRGQWYISLINGNTGNIPSDGAIWQLENKVQAVVVRPWQPGIVDAHYSLVRVGTTGYALRDTVALPFNSQVSPENDLTNWELVFGSGSGGGGGIDFLNYTFDGSSQADSDPGVDMFRINNVDPALATFIYASNEIEGGIDVTEILDALPVDSFILISRVDNLAEKAYYKIVTTAVDGGGYRKIEVSYVDGFTGVSFADGESFIFSFIPASVTPTGQDQPQFLNFSPDFDNVREITVLTPVQLSPILTNGFSSLNYETAPNDGTFVYTPRADILALNTFLAGLPALTQVRIRFIGGMLYSDTLQIVFNIA